MADLLGEIQLPQCTCLNMSKEHTLRHCLEADTRETAEHYLESDCDEELLIKISFMQACKIKAIQLHGVDTDSAPIKVRLFITPLDSLDFDSAKDEKPTQELSLSASDVSASAKPLELRFVLFQKVTSLAIFVPGNLGDEETTKISKLAIFGETIEHTGLKRSEAEQAASSKGDWLGSGIKGA